MKQLTLVYVDNDSGYGEALYVNGILFKEDYEITLQDVLETLGSQVTRLEADFNLQSAFPTQLERVKRHGS
jgi:hypothetical protein